MRNYGFTLIEVLLVMAVIAILLSIGTVNFNSWQKKTWVENQTRTLLADLNQLRLESIQRKQPRGLLLQTNGYAFLLYSSENQGRSAVTPVPVRSGNYSFIESPGPADKITLFDVRGYTDDTGTFQNNLSGTAAAVDCVVVSTGRTNIGKMSNGACTPN